MSHTHMNLQNDVEGPSLSRRECIRMLGLFGLGSVVGAGTLTALEASIDAARAAAIPGGVVPTMEFWIPNWPDMIEISRQLTEAWTKAGIPITVRQGTLDTWTAEIIGQHQMPHIAAMSWGGAPDRLDPDYFLTELLNSKRMQKGGLNYGNFSDPKYDSIDEAQRREMDEGKRQKLVREAQAISAAANPSLVLFHRDYINAYNHERWEGVVPVMGSGIAMPYIPWSYLKMKPKTNRKVVRATSIYDIHTLNPFATPEINNSSLLRWMYPAFVIRDENLKIIPWSAESWKVEDPTNIDLTIRDGMKFHDGKPVTVEDVKFTFDFIGQWKFPALARVTDSVASTEITGPRTVRFHLKEPIASFIPNVLGYAFIAPKHIWEPVAASGNLKTPADWPNDQPVGSGPFSFGEWKKGEYLFLKANKTHWAAPSIDGVYWLAVPSLENQLGMMERGEADMLGWYIDKKQGEMLSKQKHLTVMATPNHGLHELRLNMAMTPLDDPAFRRAMQQATDRKQLLDTVFGGAGTVANNTFINPKIEFWSNPEAVNLPFSIEAARTTLQQAGYTWDGSGRLLYPK